MTNLNSEIQLAISASLLKTTSKRNQRRDEGFTLLESLMAVVVVSILIVSIGPMVALSTASRVNARRVDQATQAGRAYIEAVRGQVYDTVDFPASLRSSVSAQGQYIFDLPAPTTASFPIPAGCDLNIADPNVKNIDGGRVPGVCVDANGDGFRLDDPQDLVIQPMRSGGIVADKLRDEGFWLAVRVYRADAFFSGITLKKGTEPECDSSKLVFVGTQGSPTCPLVTMRSQIILNLSLTNNKQGTGQ